MKKMNRKGFTLAELLIVVAIIAVLVAIAIPVFTAQLYKSQAATDEANIRAAYSKAVVDFLEDGTTADLSAIQAVAEYGSLSAEYVYTHTQDSDLTITFDFDPTVFGEETAEGAGG